MNNIRALEPIYGIDLMKEIRKPKKDLKTLTIGPSKLCMSFKIIKNEVNKEDLEYMKSQQNLVNQYKIDLDEGLDQHDKKAFLKCCEILAFLVRDAAHITPDNFESCIHCLRTFVEACVSSCDRENKKKTNGIAKTTAKKSR